MAEQQAAYYGTKPEPAHSESGLCSEMSSEYDDERQLAALGYRQEFKREFNNLATISFAFSIMGVSSSLTSTIDVGLLSGGPASVIWCWFVGSFMCFTLGMSIAELVSAYPTSGGLYSASAYLVPQRYKAHVGWYVGWLNMLGQVAGVASTEFGLSRLIWSAYALSLPADQAFSPTSAQLVGLYIGLLVIHGLLNSLGTKIIAQLTKGFVFVNMGAALAIIIGLSVTTPDKHSASYIFTETINNTGWDNNFLAAMLGLLSVQWTMTDYDATAHISEEVKKAAIAAPVAIAVAVIGTGIVGWILNIVIVMCSGDLTDLPGPSGVSTATILSNNVGFAGFCFIWSLVCLTAFFGAFKMILFDDDSPAEELDERIVVTTALQANSRTFYAFSRDGGLPDRGLFGKLAPNKVPIWSVWLVVLLSVILGCLQFASPIAVNAVFSLCAIALDTSYVIPIACKLLFRHHPEVMYKPGPFDLGTGWLGLIVNMTAICWTSFVIVILALPAVIPVTAASMNYAAPITGLVLLGATVWWFAGGRRHYTGPRCFTGGAFADEGKGRREAPVVELGREADKDKKVDTPQEQVPSEDKQ